ncbi:hypothetical protein PGLA_15530 [Paenibacillus glacialis]|uniref:Uncharacterized protein n=1 Tax=Paenibacillus glacialis TaxID=494026 RepID=A0A168K863_9BACL|nr:hypothetical protein PGLA_15530 [Paenibacillus glacialis]
MVSWGSQIDAAVWKYVVLFVLAALPWLDVFLVVPLGISWGLSPIGVGIIGFAGNLLTVNCYRVMHFLSAGFSLAGKTQDGQGKGDFGNDMASRVGSSSPPRRGH